MFRWFAAIVFVAATGAGVFSFMGHGHAGPATNHSLVRVAGDINPPPPDDGSGGNGPY